MTDWNQLSQRAQVRRLGELARRAIVPWGLTRATVRPVNHGENATFRVRAEEGEFLLRVHRHAYRSAAQIAAELTFLRRARATGLAVPEPVSTRAGTWVQLCAHPAVPHARHITVLRWMDGRMHWRRTRPIHARRIGELAAELHHFATRLDPAEMPRPRLDIDGNLRGDFGHIDEVPWLDPSERDLVRRTEARIRAVLAELPPEATTLIHADLHLGNVLHRAGRAAAIDFDDMGVGTPSLDLSVSWNSLHEKRRPGALCDALLEGYATRRPLPTDIETRLQAWGTVRELTILAWLADRQDVADLRTHRASTTQRVLARCQRALEVL